MTADQYHTRGDDEYRGLQVAVALPVADRGHHQQEKGSGREQHRGEQPHCQFHRREPGQAEREMPATRCQPRSGAGDRASDDLFSRCLAPTQQHARLCLVEDLLDSSRCRRGRCGRSRPDDMLADHGRFDTVLLDHDLPLQGRSGSRLRRKRIDRRILLDPASWVRFCRQFNCGHSTALHPTPSVGGRTQSHCSAGPRTSRLPSRSTAATCVHSGRFGAVECEGGRMPGMGWTGYSLYRRSPSTMKGR